MATALAIVFLALVIIWRSHVMSAALDALTASITALEAASTAAVAEIASLKSGSTDAALPALQQRVDAVTTELGGTPPAPAA